MTRVYKLINQQIEALKSLKAIEAPSAVLMLNKVKELIEQVEWERLEIPEEGYEKDFRVDQKKEASHPDASHERGHVWGSS